MNYQKNIFELDGWLDRQHKDYLHNLRLHQKGYSVDYFHYLDHQRQ